MTTEQPDRYQVDRTAEGTLKITWTDGHWWEITAYVTRGARWEIGKAGAPFLEQGEDGKGQLRNDLSPEDRLRYAERLEMARIANTTVRWSWPDAPSEHAIDMLEIWRVDDVKAVQDAYYPRSDAPLAQDEKKRQT